MTAEKQKNITKDEHIARTGTKPPRPPIGAEALARVVLVLTGAMWIAVGLWALLYPMAIGDMLDLRPESSLGRLEIRAVYGGLAVALGALQILAASRAAWLTQGLALAGGISAGVLAGRILSIVIEGTYGPTALILIGGGAGHLTITLLASWRLLWARHAKKKIAKKKIAEAKATENEQAQAAEAGAQADDLSD